MNCAYHNDRNAEFVCSQCGKPLCRECTAGIGGKNICLSCANNTVGYNMPQYGEYRYKKRDDVNGFLFFVFMLVPGLRQMYLGAMKRGLHFLVAFFGLIGFAAILGNGLEGLFFPVAAIVWFYSAFDSYQLRKNVRRGQTLEDRPLFENYGFDDVKQYVGGRKYLVGTAAIILGAYLLLRRVRWYVGGLIMSNVIGNIIFRTIDFIFDALIPLVFIVLGVYLLNKVKKSKKAIETQALVSEECVDEQ